MAFNRKRVVAASAAAVLTATLAACGGGTSPDTSTGDGEAVKGGTLTYIQHYPYESVDPQRVYYGEEIAAFRRIVYRSLVALPFDKDPDVANTPIPDLATDAGTSTDNGATWAFTLKDGIKWEDGSDITCEDFKYGASRAFADDVLTGGAGFYFKDYLKLDGAYSGPYKGKGQEFFDKAVVCDGKTITYHFNKPWPDFPLAIAALTATDPYKKSFDKGPQSTWKILSNGPYKVANNDWSKDKGATFVRNTSYDSATDDAKLREANPDEIRYELLTETEPVIDRLIADAGDDAAAVSGTRIPPAYFAQIDASMEDRTALADSPYVRYLIFNNEKIKDPKVRKAITLATDVNGVITANGGEKAGAPAQSLVNPNVGGYKAVPEFEERELGGDPEAAKTLLEEAGVKMPYPLKYTYAQSETQDKAAAILKEGWEKAGFKVTLDPQGDTYYDVIGKRAKDSDVMYAGWGADWPSAMTVTVPLLTCAPADAKDSSTNYGFYCNEDVDALFDKAANAKDIDEQNTFLQEADELLAADSAYVPLFVEKFYLIHGSKVGGFMPNAASNGYPDLGPVFVKK